MWAAGKDQLALNRDGGISQIANANTHLTGDGDESRSRRLSVFRGLPWGSDGFRSGRKVTDALDDFLDPLGGRPLSYEDCREWSTWHSSEMDARVVVVLASVDAGANN